MRIKGDLQLKNEQDGKVENVLMSRIQKLQHLVDELVTRYNIVIQCDEE